MADNVTEVARSACMAAEGWGAVVCRLRIAGGSDVDALGTSGIGASMACLLRFGGGYDDAALGGSWVGITGAERDEEA